MKKNTSGFTIIELLVVISVIVVLAAIVLITYNNIQAAARTAQTTNAATSWLKGLKVYQARNGSLPQYSSCLGAYYLYNMDGTGTSGTAQCGQFSGKSYVVDPNFSSIMDKYMSGLPAPAMVTAANNASSWYRGITYVVDTVTNTAVMYFALDSGQTCPLKVGDTPRIYGGPTSGVNTNMVCMYKLGSSNTF